MLRSPKQICLHYVSVLVWLQLSCALVRYAEEHLQSFSVQAERSPPLLPSALSGIDSSD